MSRPKAWAAELAQAPLRQRTDSSNGETEALTSIKGGLLWADNTRDDGVDSTLRRPEEWRSRWEVGRTGSESNHNDSVLIPSTDKESRLATQANEKRTAILEAQNNHLMRLASAKNAVNDRQAGHIHRLSQKHATELQHVNFINDQIFESLRTDLRDEVERLAKEVKSVPAVASDLLKADDRALAELNELSLSISVKQEGALDVDELQGRADRLTRALHLFRAGAVKDRLDLQLKKN
ncbi:hypothetical protein G647_02920 [Cladophialophora carrionii CBS 160.54]|uniref:Uncharacterized protein n=1 Tax=Cladophialophora carrionii CBS 160.54 TaxID=1279043 RepID=V9DIJ4_9EURO|nr:uncharacterized protein G647_02920 [Cladophialophora carrionii CBS 160.54]ETI26143.1 hypothetical protein G647_02920 [Cladophialophora carrionii CBS 160.54]